MSRHLDHSVAILMRAIERAIDNGEVCPSNDAIAGLLSLSSPSAGTTLINAAVKKGLIAVERGHHSRVVTVLATGKRTVAITDGHWLDREGEPAVPRRTRGPSIHTHARPRPIPDELLPPRVDRDPCPRCGVRADVGCRHRAAGVFV